MPPYEEALGDGLVLRHVGELRDAQRYMAFHARMFDRPIARSVDYLMHHHPTMGYENFIYVEDTNAREIVSTVALIPWRGRYEQVALGVAMLEMVVTDANYRHKGLIRAQVRRFHEMVDACGYDLSLIEGIPYYYRQYGYSYAVDHRAYDALPAWCVPPLAPALAERFALRAAVLDDAPRLAELDAENLGRLALANARDAAYWRFLLQWDRYPVRVVEDRAAGGLVGYLATAPLGETGGVRVLESSIASQAACLVVLHQLQSETRGEIQLGWPATSTLVRVGRSLGSGPLPAYQWLWRVPDMPRLLTRIAPALERRLAASECAGLTADLTINIFRQAYRLSFRGGTLAQVEAAGFVDSSMGADGGDLCIPPEAFTRLVLGYRTLDQLRDAWPDIVIRPASRRVLDVLFPAMSSYLLMPYLYCGAVEG
jgi:predicted N-acetyltransferase YhbS